MYEDIGYDKMYQLYCAVYPNMDSKTFKTFDEFRGKQQRQIIKHNKKIDKTTTEILKEVERVMNSTVRG